VPEARRVKQTLSVPLASAEGSAEAAAPMPHPPPSAVVDPAPSDAAATIRAPTALRPILNDVQDSPPQETVAARPATNAAPESSPSLAPPLPSTPSKGRQRPRVESQPFSKDASVATSVQSPSVRRSAPAVVDLMEARQTVATSPSIAEVEHERMTSEPPRQAQVLLPPQPRPEATADPLRSGQIEADSRSTTEAEQHRTTPAPPLQQRGASHANSGPLPAQQAPVASISTSADGRQSRITIGRIDAQVNNHPPAPPSAPPASETSLIAADTLEGRFLSRFALKL
jgi:hypothetical protein